MSPTHTIRWRLNDPAQEWRQRWTKVHRVSFHANDLTVCHILIPEFPYDSEHDGQIPVDAIKCKRCLTANE